MIVLCFPCLFSLPKHCAIHLKSVRGWGEMLVIKGRHVLAAAFSYFRRVKFHEEKEKQSIIAE